VIEDEIALSIDGDGFIAATFDRVQGARIWELSQAGDLYRTLLQSALIIGWEVFRDIRRLSFVASPAPLEKRAVGLAYLLRESGATGLSLKSVTIANLDTDTLTAAEGYADDYQKIVWRSEALFELYHAWRASGLAVREELIPWPLAGKER